MDKLATLWAFVRRRKYLITFAAFVVVVGFLDENSIVRRMGYANEISRLNSEIEKYRAEYEENIRTAERTGCRFRCHRAYCA